jgi:ATP-binding cassette, subfamily B, bacterial
MRTQSDLLLRYLRPRWAALLLLLGALAGSTVLQLLTPRVLGRFIDNALGGAGAAFLITLALTYIGMATGLQLLSLASTYLGQNLAWQATNDLRGDLFDQVLRLGLPFHNRRTPGELIQRIDGDVGALAGFLSQFSVQILGNALLLAGVLAVLFGTDWRIGLIFFLFTLVTLWVFRSSRTMAVPAQKQNAEAKAQLMGFIEERLGGLEEVRSNGAGEHVMQGLFRLSRVRLRTIVKSYLMYAVRWSVTHTTFTMGNLLALGLGTLLFFQGRVSLGTVYLIYSYTDLLLTPLQEISNQMQDLQKATAGTERVLELFALMPEQGAETRPGGGAAWRPGGGLPARPSAGPAPLPPGPLGLELANLTFRYDQSTPALDGVSLRLAPGRILGVIGRTGSGKSTLARLLLRFYDPSGGEIRLGGQEIRAISPHDLRTRVALVTQEVQLFQGTVRENVTIFDSAVPDEAITHALNEVGLGEWLGAQPAGLETRLGSGGAGLSAGQAQLLAFARVLLRDPGLIILDEASSRLDPATERLLDQAMARLLQGRTAILIAHRLATLERVDEILVLEGGTVAEHGAQRLLADDPDSHYARLRRVGLGEVLA